MTLLCLVLGIWPGPDCRGGACRSLRLRPRAPHQRARSPAGSKNFSNTAYNSRVLAWVTAGESLHNNHHAYPRSPKFSVRRSEFDPSWLVIRALATVGLVVITGTPATLADGGAHAGEPWTSAGTPPSGSPPGCYSEP
jgi:hypothetical protein